MPSSCSVCVLAITIDSTTVLWATLCFMEKIKWNQNVPDMFRTIYPSDLVWFCLLGRWLFISLTQWLSLIAASASPRSYSVSDMTLPQRPCCSFALASLLTLTFLPNCFNNCYWSLSANTAPLWRVLSQFDLNTCESLAIDDEVHALNPQTAEVKRLL